jgi:hypothetical protein
VNRALGLCAALGLLGCVDNIRWERTFLEAQQLEGQAQLQNAVGKYRLALDLTRQLPSEHPYRLSSTGSLARALFGLGRFAESADLRRELTPALERIHGADHPTVAKHLHGLALTLKAGGQGAEAEPLEARAIAICQRQLAAHQTAPWADADAVLALHLVVAQFHEDFERAPAADNEDQRALELSSRSGDKLIIAQALEAYAAFLRRAGNATKADELERRSRALQAPGPVLIGPH